MSYKKSTYGHGFIINMPKDCCFRKSTIVAICRQLGQAFGEGNEFEPEPICMGFLIWTKWPGKDDEGYKCMRLAGTPSKGYGSYSWPFVPSNVMELWNNDDEPVVEPGRYYTVLKAFYTAPKWTVQELTIIKACLELHGAKVVRMPRQSKLDYK